MLGRELYSGLEWVGRERRRKEEGGKERIQPVTWDHVIRYDVGVQVRCFARTLSKPVYSMFSISSRKTNESENNILAIDLIRIMDLLPYFATVDSNPISSIYQPVVFV